MNDKGHLILSIAKSFIRMIGCCGAFIGIIMYPELADKTIIALAISFGVAEVLGIFEELVDKRK